jgi:hypothetical protein
MKQEILNWLDSHGRKTVIYDRISESPYLERYYLFLRDRKSFPFNVFLHKFLRGDPDDVHDHPWPYFTLILCGGYFECVPIFKDGLKVGENRYWRGPGHFRINKATSYHRIELDPNITCWTLFIPGPHQREWGFLVNNKWIRYDEYLQGKYEEAHNQQ